MRASQRRERVRRTLTFWLRPAFALRVVGRFQRIAGFDRSMALASSALTTLVPLAVLVATLLARFGQQDLGGRIVRRYGLSGGGAEAVTTLFSYESGPDSTLSVFGSLFLIISALSFTRAAQRLFEQTWELPPLSVRNTVNGLLWLLLLVPYAALVGWLQAALSGARFGLAAAVCQLPLTAAFLVGTGWLLSARRRGWRDLVPFGVIGAVLTALYTVGTAVYLPRLFSSYASRYGPLGAVFAMITALFGAMLVIVGSAAIGREVADELDRIREGRRPPDDEVRREWDKVITQMRERWTTARAELGHRRESGGPQRRRR
jgi:membrane protein